MGSHLFARLFLLSVFAITLSVRAQTAFEIVPAAASRGARVLLVGTRAGIDGVVTVQFQSASGYIPATIASRSASVIELLVPSAAVSGDVQVRTSHSTIASLPFTVTPNPPFSIVKTLVASVAGREPLKLPGGLETSTTTVLAADQMHHRIASIAADGTTTTYAGTGRAGFADGPLAAAEFRNPQAISWDVNRTALFVADTGNHAIRRIEGGQVTTIAGTGRRGDRDGAAALAEFTVPAGIAAASDGTIYVADTGNHKVKAITPAGEVATIAGTGQAGFLDGTVSELRVPEGHRRRS